MEKTKALSGKLLLVVLAMILAFGICVPSYAFANGVDTAKVFGEEGIAGSSTDDAQIEKKFVNESDNEQTVAKGASSEKSVENTSAALSKKNVSKNAAVVEEWEIGSPTASGVRATLYDDGSLVIGGSGNVRPLYASVPWDSKAADIKTVTIENGVTPTSLEDWFYGCTSLVSVSSIPDSVENMMAAFAGCTSLVSVPKIPGSVTNMSRCFSGCTSLIDAPDMSDASSVMDMSGAFYGCTSLASAPAIPSSVSDLSRAFLNCTSLENAPDMSNADGVVDMSRTFEGCASLKNAPTIPNTVKNMTGTFGGCVSLAIAPVIPDGVKYMYASFANCESLVSIPMIPSGVKSMHETFANCPAVTSIPSGWKFPEECTDTERCFFVPDDSSVVTYCDSADYEYLSSAYDWEASNRALTVNPVDSANDGDGNGDGDDDVGIGVNDANGADDKSDSGKGNLAQTGDRVSAEALLVLLGTAFVSLFVAVGAAFGFKRNQRRW